ncbi:PAQR family membrane homeostasis protein TrhA [Desulforhopalus singaporensis]|uniref:Hemolysin III n=1 Tax=Desulforhopalus singaporensis TaxID=91360 RepID=A0A1H0Q1Q6_9BACT|nr:hemolysin III family protein [Desulforhopalus singaporensis]SDP10636.1 hemolysin III [Desulforhopalus singaporensis]
MKAGYKSTAWLSFGEEVANAVTHGVAAILVLISMPFAYITAYKDGNLVDLIGVAVFCIAIFLMFINSMIYHIMEPGSRHKEIMRIMDHIFIYVAIAGTYTPIALSVIAGWQAIVILTVQWIAVVAGILYKSLARMSIPKVSVMIYLIMGWTLVIFMPMFVRNANHVLFWLILTGGILYSAGAAIYAQKGFKYHHMVWHLFVFLAACTHFTGICFFLYD